MSVDTLEYAKKLEAAGVDRRQAEAHAEALRVAIVPELATRADLDSAVAAIRHDIDVVKRDIDVVKAESAGRFTPLYWIMGANLGISLAVLWRLVR